MKISSGKCYEAKDNKQHIGPIPPAFAADTKKLFWIIFVT